MEELCRIRIEFLRASIIGLTILFGCMGSEDKMPEAMAESISLPKSEEILRAFVTSTTSVEEATAWQTLPPDLVNKMMSHLARFDRDAESSILVEGISPQIVPLEYEILLVCRDFSSLQIFSDASLTQHYVSGSSKWFSGTRFVVEDTTFSEEFRRFQNRNR